MPFFDSNAVAWLVLGAFGGAIVSAIVPWVNAEILLLSAVAIRRDATIPLVIAVALGQMVGKSVLYWLARSAKVPRAQRFASAIERWRARFQGHPFSSVLIMGVSAVTGFPPFYIISIVAGALRISYVVFLIVGSLGRLAHFALFALVPHVASRWF
jgi:membrane protein YqaA with SNARE-associated domain